MATQSLSQYMSETSKAYDNSRQALQSQIDNVATDLAAQQERINAQYAQQSKTLDNQRNYQAQSSSMASSNNGGSFGGANEIANKKYYQQTYVPAVTQMQTNQANDLSSAESTANSNKLSLSSQLAALNDEANQTALSQYYTAVEAEKARQATASEAAKDRAATLKAAQISANATANAYKYLNSSSSSSTNSSTSKYAYKADSSMADGISIYNTSTGNAVRFATLYGSQGGDFSDTKDLLNTVASIYGTSSSYYKELSSAAQQGYTFSKNTASSKNYKATGNSVYDALGLKATKKK